MPLIQRHVIGVDVGTASVRAGVFDLSGRLLGVATQDITVYRSADGHVEQSSSEIWRAVCMTVRSAPSVAGIAASYDDSAPSSLITIKSSNPSANFNTVTAVGDPRTCEEAVDRSPLRLPSDQHRRSLCPRTVARSRTN